MKLYEGKMQPQSKDISDISVLNAIKKTTAEHGGMWSCLGHVQEELAQFPERVVLAKLKSMIKRKLIDGCACGCRGEFTINPQSS